MYLTLLWIELKEATLGGFENSIFLVDPETYHCAIDR